MHSISFPLFTTFYPNIVSQPATIYVDLTAFGANNGINWTNAYRSLSEAILNAQAADEIRVAKGTYYPTDGTDRTISFDGTKDILLSGGYPNQGGARDIVANPTILSGNINNRTIDTDNSYHVLQLTYTSLDGFIIEKGYADGTNATFPAGGGIFLSNIGAPATISNCIFSNNLPLCF